MKNERNAGAKKKFPNTETEILHIRKKVPKGTAKDLKLRINILIDNIDELVLTDTQRIEAYYNRDKDNFTPISQISKKLQSEILTILNRK